MRVQRIIDSVALIGCGALLLIAIWRIEAMNEKLDDARTDHPGGQVVTTGKVRTERFLGEPVNEWARRHEEALERFEEGE